MIKLLFIALLLIPSISNATANTSLFDKIKVTVSEQFSNLGAGVCSLDGSGNVSSTAPGTNGNVLTSNGSAWVSSAPAAGGVTTMGAFGSTPNSNGASISGTTLTMQPADGSNPGEVSTSAQTIAGAKTFSSTPTFSTMTVGSALFAGTAGVLAQDNANFFWDATNHRLGINNNSPTHDLHIVAKDTSSDASLFLARKVDNNGWNISVDQQQYFYLTASGGYHNLITAHPGGEVFFDRGIESASASILNIGPSYDLASSINLLTLWPTASLTGNNFQVYDTAGNLKIVFNKDAAATFSNGLSANTITDSGLGAGIARTSAGGLFSSSEISGDATTSGSNVLTLATVNGSPGATAISTITTNGKGLVTSNTAASTTGSGNVVLATSPTMTNPVVGTQSAGDNSTKAASTAFVQAALAQLNPAAAVTAASTANIVGTYTNAVGGVCIADTFQVTSTAAFVVDGITPTVGQRILFKNQTSGFQNGVWTLTTAANVGVLGALLTRALDWDSSADMNAGNLIPVISGTANATTVWFQTSAITTCSSDSQVYTQFSGGGGGGCVAPVLTKTTSYVVLAGDFTCANKILFLEANCSANCTITLPAASNTGYEVKAINVGAGTATISTAGSDTFGSTLDTTWALVPGGNPQSSNTFWANGGSRWNGM